MAENQKITHEAGNDEAWVCICGNTPDADGFYTCDESGNEVEPTREKWTSGLYVCASCKRMIDPTTLEIVSQPAMVPEDEERS